MYSKAWNDSAPNSYRVLAGPTGDLITTGTPPGVALGMKPTPVFLKAGDEMRLGIQGLGEQRQKVHAWNPQLIDD